MGLSLLNIGKKIWDVGSGVERQLNPFDGGATYANPRPAPTPAPNPSANPYNPMASQQQFQQNMNSQHNPFVNPSNPFSPTQQASNPSVAAVTTTAVKPVRPAQSFAPVAGDIPGLTKAVQGLASYHPEDQVRILNRAAQVGLVPRNVSAAYINSILSPDVNQGNLPSTTSTALQTAEKFLPGAPLYKQVGIDLAGNRLYDQGKIDPGIVQSTLAQANADNGGMVNGNFSINPAKFAGTSTSEIMKALTYGKAPGFFAAGEAAPTLTAAVKQAATTGAKFGVPMGVGETLQQDNPTLASAGKNILENVITNAAMAGAPAIAGHLGQQIRDFNPEGVSLTKPLNEAGTIGGKNAPKANPQLPTEPPKASLKQKSNNFQPKTEIDQINRILENKDTVGTGQKIADYYRTAKGEDWKVVNMAPDEYLQRAAKAMGQDPTTWRNFPMGDVKKYTADMKKGNKFPMPWINEVTGNQEGRSRALAAKAAGQKEIPVAIATKYIPKRPTTSLKQSEKPPVVETSTPTAPSVSLKVTGLPEQTAAAGKELAERYNRPIHSSDDAVQLLRKNIGNSREFSKLGNKLETAMSNEYSLKERTQARDFMEGAIKKVTPRVKALAKLNQQLNEMGYKVLDKTTPSGIHRVGKYATRVLNSSVKPGMTTGEKVKAQLSDIFNMKSGFAKQRVIQKFVSKDGEVRYGTQTDAGLKMNRGALQADGKTFKPAFVSQKELNQAGYDYEKDYGKAANSYHSSVGRTKAANDTITELTRDPARYGLITEPVKGYEAISGDKRLEGYYAPKLVAHVLNHEFNPRAESAVERAWQGFNSGVIQSIVFNPLIHGRNLNELAGLALAKTKGLEGMPAKYKAYTQYATMGKDARDALDTRMNDSGVRQTTYGSERQTILTRAADKAGIPHISKMGPAAMASLDHDITAATFHALTTGKNVVADDEAAKIINQFMGDVSHSGPIAQNIGLFWHYLSTRAGILKAVATHPVENRGVMAGLAAQAAIFYGTTKAFQDWTDNKHASIGHPGMFGLVNEAVNLVHGNPSSVVTQNINPVAQAIGNQIYGKDLFTKKDISQDRLGNLMDTLFGPTQYTNKVSSGKASVGQAVVQATTGANLPHAKGAPAVPNKAFPGDSVLNTKDSQPVKEGGDKTGIDQQAQYFKAKGTLLNGLDPSSKDATTINNYLASNVDAATGQKLKNGVVGGYNNAKDLVDNYLKGGDALQRIYTFEHSQNQDPLWQLPLTAAKGKPSILAYLTYQSQYEGPEKTGTKQFVQGDAPYGTGWIDKLNATRNTYFQTLPGSKKGDAPEPAYPTFQGQQNTDYTAAQNITDPAKWSAFVNAHPDVIDAQIAIHDWENQIRKREGAPTDIPTMMKASPEVQQIIKTYDSLPQHDGKKGGNASRAAWIQANPDAWNTLTNYYAQSGMNSLLKNAVESVYSGQYGNNQTLLKDVQNVGKDVTLSTDSGGKNTYSLNPSLAYATGANSSSFKYTPYTSSYRSSPQYKDARYLSNSEKMRVHGKNGKFSGPKISLKNGTKGSKGSSVGSKSLTLTPMKVSLKKSKV